MCPAEKGVSHMTTTAVTLGKLLAIRPEHEVPNPGDIVEYAYEKGDMPVTVTLTTDVAGIATFMVTADAAEMEYSLEAARKALVRSTGNDPEKPASLDRARATFGAQAFDQNVIYLAKQRLLCLAYMRTGILPFLVPDFPHNEVPVEGQDFTFMAHVRLRPRGTVEDFSPVHFAFPAKPEVTDEDLDDFVGQMMGGLINMDAVPEEARPGMERLRGQAREACEKKRDAEWWGALMDAAGEEFSNARLTSAPGERYIAPLAELMANQLAAQIERTGRNWDEFTSDPEFNMDEFKQNMMANAELSLRRGMALDCVAAHEGMTLSEEDVLALLGPVAPGTEAIAAQAMIDNGELPQLVEVALRAKANDWLAKNAVDTAGEHDEAAE